LVKCGGFEEYKKFEVPTDPNELYGSTIAAHIQEQEKAEIKQMQIPDFKRPPTSEDPLSLYPSKPITRSERMKEYWRNRKAKKEAVP